VFGQLDRKSSRSLLAVTRAMRSHPARGVRRGQL